MIENSIALNDYEIIRLLGEGGTARVYLAKNSRRNRPVAVKVPLVSDKNQNYDHLLEREYNLIGGINFPGLVRVYELNKNADNGPALILEYCPHKSLQSLNTPLAHDRLIELLSAISINLYYLNLLGIYHGDLKPDNIFSAREEPWDVSSASPPIKISDFSLGKRDREEDAKRLGLGTVGYIAPETLTDKKLNHRSDLFALGVIAYEIATGEHPFRDRDNDPVRINSKIKEYHPASPAEMNSSIPKESSDLIMALLEKDPEKRPKNAWEVCRVLESRGAEFPYRRIIRPKYLFAGDRNDSIEDFLAQEFFDFEKETIEYLEGLSGGNFADLRGLLEINYNKGNIVWENGKLRVNSESREILWPKRLKRDTWKRFAEFPHSVKRRAIKTAVIGKLRDAGRIGLDAGDSESRVTYGMIKCLREELSPITIKKQAGTIAGTAKETEGCSDIVARMYIVSRDIEPAYHAALEASRVLTAEGRYEETYRLLQDLIDLCREENETEKLRKTLMELGDAQKSAGDAARAEATYREIISCYTDDTGDKLLAEAYKDLGDVYKIKQNFDAGIEALQKAVKIYSELDDQLELSHTLNNIGNIHTINAEHDKAFQAYRRALRIQRRLKSMNDVASTLNNMATYYYSKGRFDRIKRLFNLSLVIGRESGNQAEVARVQNNLGFIYHELGQFDRAVESLMESQEIIRKTGIRKELLYNLNNLTEVMLSAGRLRESLGFLKEGVELANELSDKPHKAFFLNNMGAVLKRMGYLGQALEKIQEAIQLGNDIDDIDHPVICRIRLAEIYRRVGDRERAESLIDEIVDISGRHNINRAIISAHVLRGLINENIEEFTKAYEIAHKAMLEREADIIKLQIMDFNLSRGKFDFPQEWIDEAYQRFHFAGSDIEKARCYNTLGSYYLKINDFENASRFFNLAYRTSRESSLNPENMEASRNLGRVSTAGHEYETAFRYYRAAMETLKKMAGDIKDEAYRKGFLTTPEILEMSRELGALREKLSGTKETGSR